MRLGSRRGRDRILVGFTHNHCRQRAPVGIDLSSSGTS